MQWDSLVQACCPVLAMPSYLRCCHAKPAAPLSHFQSGRPLSVRRLRSTLHSLLRQNSYDPENYNTYSFRIGAARAGLPPGTITQLGHWRSDAYSTYVRHTPNHSSTTAQIARAPCFLPMLCCVCNPHLFVHYHTPHFGSSAFMGGQLWAFPRGATTQHIWLP